MLNRLKKIDNKGFTIIEVMIVLAIAGLIILIVLLAVPALQRNGRNTAIKNDASAVVAGVTEFASNNDGKIPTSAGSTCSTGSVSLKAATGSASVPKVQGGTEVDCSKTGAVTINLVDADRGKLYVVFGAKCPDVPAGASAVTTTASSRSVSVVYVTETNSTNLGKCVDG